ncbi:alpha-ribazole phosphatase [Chitinophaga sp. YR573]|uniref:histidine phosphatase family protein n=1 Tax=Chitinophaga sp. YR573 TaxID=1881040 RepID=UPI0008B354AF|nr:histidine phosphatase family protein [Chitinophaga sp. YR573]SEW39235.1 alpha-ribazole phosphatase [Chitinophaga sp. YR573]
MEISFIRHIKPSIAAGICYGQLDVPVPDESYQHIISADVVYSSPLVRCTALAKQLSPSPITDPRLMELHFGDWEGKKWDEIDEAALQVWGDDYINLSPPNGESLMELLERLRAFIDEVTSSSYKKIIIVTHAGIIRCAMHLFNNIPLHQIMMEKVDFGGIYTFKL